MFRERLVDPGRTSFDRLRYPRVLVARSRCVGSVRPCAADAALLAAREPLVEPVQHCKGLHFESFAQFHSQIWRTKGVSTNTDYSRHVRNLSLSLSFTHCLSLSLVLASSYARFKPQEALLRVILITDTDS